MNDNRSNNHSVNGNGPSKTNRERSQSPFLFPRKRRSVRPRLYLSIDSDSEWGVGPRMIVYCRETNGVTSKYTLGLIDKLPPLNSKMWSTYICCTSLGLVILAYRQIFLRVNEIGDAERCSGWICPAKLGGNWNYIYWWALSCFHQFQMFTVVSFMLHNTIITYFSLIYLFSWSAGVACWGLLIANCM